MIDEGIEMLRLNLIESGVSKTPISKPTKRAYNKNGKDFIFLYSLKDEKRSEVTINALYHTKIESFHKKILICSEMKNTTENV